MMSVPLNTERPYFNALQSILKDLEKEEKKLNIEVQRSQFYLRNNRSGNNFEKIDQDYNNIVKRQVVISNILNKFIKSLGKDLMKLPHKTQAQTGEKFPREYTREELLQERAMTERAANASLQDFIKEVGDLLSTKSDQKNSDPNSAIKTYILHDSWLPVFLQRIINTAKEAIGVKNSSQKLVENINDVSEKLKEAPTASDNLSARYKTLKRDGMPNNETGTLQEKATNSPQPGLW
jgi:hypothetical protein